MAVRFLVCTQGGTAPRGTTLAADKKRRIGTDWNIEFLFQVPTPPTTGLAEAPSNTKRSWHVVTRLSTDWDGLHPFDLCHRLNDEDALKADFGGKIVAIEPDFEQTWLYEPRKGSAGLGMAIDHCAPDGPNTNVPLPKHDPFTWHLKSSGLGTARKAVTPGAQQLIKIFHLDTGIDPKHELLPINLDRKLEKSFVPGETNADATDQTPTGGLLRNRGHGTGTIGLLAGSNLKDATPVGGCHPC